MSVLTVTAKGQVTLRKEVLQHLGIRPGDRITIDKLPEGRVMVRAAQPSGRISDAFGMLKRAGGASLSVEEMNRIAAEGLGFEPMKITADTNVLVRALTDDDASQSQVATTELAAADVVALPLAVLCELVWVLNRGYHISPTDIADAIQTLIDGAGVVVNRPAVDAGLALLAAGGDFADGVIAYEGRWLGADVFLSFDKTAVTLLQAQGENARLLS